MYICICAAVTERHIEEAVELGARRLRDLRLHLGVSGDCGRCASCAHRCLSNALETKNPKTQGGLANCAMRALTGLPVELGLDAS